MGTMHCASIELGNLRISSLLCYRELQVHIHTHFSYEATFTCLQCNTCWQIFCRHYICELISFNIRLIIGVAKLRL